GSHVTTLPTSKPLSRIRPSGPGLNSMPMRPSEAPSSSTSASKAAAGPASTSSVTLTVPPSIAAMMSAPRCLQQELDCAVGAAHQRSVELPEVHRLEVDDAGVLT